MRLNCTFYADNAPVFLAEVRQASVACTMGTGGHVVESAVI